MSLLFGWGSLVLTDMYWPAVTMIFGGFALLVLDLWTEPPLKGNHWRYVVTLVIVGASCAFGRWFVWVPAPLELTGFWDGTDYREESDIGEGKIQIPKKSTSRLTLYIHNTSPKDYVDLDFRIWIPEAVITIKQSTEISCEEIADNPVTPPPSYFPAFPVRPYRYRCDRLPKGATMVFIAVLVNADNFRENMKQRRSLEELFGPKRKPKVIGVNGAFSLNYHPHSIDTLIKLN